jgi:UDP:flavonoid glycosyltransferase YjiC (YdhE family)
LASGPPPIYFELGSLTVLVQETVRTVLRGISSAGCRVVVDRRGTDLGGVHLTEEVYVLRESVPHAWIFPRVGAAVTHGGPGTVAAVVRAGIPAQILPIFRGHSFWGHRLCSLGVGLPPIPARKVTSEQIASSACTLLQNSDMRCRAAELGRQIRREDGVQRGVEVFERYFPTQSTTA